MLSRRWLRTSETLDRVTCPKTTGSETALISLRIFTSGTALCIGFVHRRQAALIGTATSEFIDFYER